MMERFSKKAILAHLKKVPDWKLSSHGRSIYLKIRTKNFVAAVKLISEIARLAEKIDHHPDIHLTRYRHLRIQVSTHAIGDLSKKDFILATKISQLLN